MFLAACLWREAGFGRLIGLPFWSAPPQRLHGLGLNIGADWLPAFLGCVAEAAQQARRQLHRLQQAEGAASTLTRTARSKLDLALEACSAAIWMELSVDQDGDATSLGRDSCRC